MQAGILPKGTAGACWCCPALPAAQSVFEACFEEVRRLLRHTWDGMSVHTLPKAGVHVLSELGKPWVHKAELRPTSSVLAFRPYDSHGAIAYLPVRPRHGCWGLLRPEHPPTRHLRVSLHSQRTSGKCALTVRRRRSPSCGSGWCSWRSGWSLSWAPGRGLSKRQVLPALGTGGDRDSPGSLCGVGLTAGAGCPLPAPAVGKASQG